MKNDDGEETIVKNSEKLMKNPGGVPIWRFSENLDCCVHI